MALANGWVIACPKDCAGDSDALGDCTLYIEYFKRIKDVPGKKDNTPGRPNNGEVRDTLASGWFDDAGQVDEFGKQPWYSYRNRIREVVVLDTWAPESGRYLFDGLTQSTYRNSIHRIARPWRACSGDAQASRSFLISTVLTPRTSRTRPTCSSTA